MSEPRQYEQRSLASLADYINGFAFKPSHLGEVGTPVVRIEQLNNPDGRFDRTTLVPPLRNHLDSGDIVFSWSGTLKASRWRHGKAYLNQHLFKVTPKAGVNDEFLLQLLQYSIPELSMSAHGSTMKHIQRGELEKFVVHFPCDEGEQRRIADLLSAVDELLATGSARLRKLANKRAGIVQQVLLPAATAAEEVPLGAIAPLVTSGSRGWASYYSDDGALFLRIGNLTRLHPNLRLDDVVRVKVPAGGEGARTRLVEGDVLISITADLGIVGCVPSGLGEAYVNQHIALARISDPSMNPRWVAHVLASPYGAGQIARLNDGGAKAGLNLPTIRALKVPKPSTEKQRTITAALDAVDAQMSAEQASIRKLALQKQGLLRSLLEGSARSHMGATL